VGIFLLKAIVSDSEGRTADAHLALVVSPRLALVRESLATASIGRPYRAKITISGGAGATKFKVVSGRLPSGIHLDPKTGVLSGRPSTGGSYRIVILVRDTLGATARRTYALTVR
jgi:large repetitive protein